MHLSNFEQFLCIYAHVHVPSGPVGTGMPFVTTWPAITLYVCNFISFQLVNIPGFGASDGEL